MLLHPIRMRGAKVIQQDLQEKGQRSRAESALWVWHCLSCGRANSQFRGISVRKSRHHRNHITVCGHKTDQQPAEATPPHLSKHWSPAMARGSSPTLQWERGSQHSTVPYRKKILLTTLDKFYQQLTSSVPTANNW